MENEPQNQTNEDSPVKKTAKKSYPIPASILISAVILAGAWVYTSEPKTNTQQENPTPESEAAELEEKVLPSEGVVLPIVWGDLGARLVDAGAIDENKFTAVYIQRGVFTDEYKNLLVGRNNGELRMTRENAGYLLNLFWALGLANKNPILDSGEMTDPKYGGAQRFASTAGWTLAKDDPMDHYSRHSFFELTADQQALVDKISRGIYRPCCGNSTHFPDCNHGMAMLGLLELMASQGVNEQDMWKTALAVNSYWFPDTYLTIAQHFANRDIAWDKVNAEEVLGASYSSAQGYQQILKEVQPIQFQGGGSCGV